MKDDEDDDVRTGTGWFVTLLGAGLLVLAGFALGVVVGAVREEPAMLLQYVTGKTSDMPAPAAMPPQPQLPERPIPSPAADFEEPPSVEAAAPAVAAVRPVAAAKPENVPPPLVSTGPRPDPPSSAVASASAGSRFAVQVGAFAQSTEAERLEAQLRKKGLPVYVQPSTGERDSRWRVRVGPLASRAEADKVATRLKSQDKLPVWILEETGT